MNIDQQISNKNQTVIWALTPNGCHIAAKIQAHMPAKLYLPDSMVKNQSISNGFKNLKQTVTQLFNDYKNHIFIMATGIVVRLIAPLIKSKLTDPAVIVIDDAGKYVISLLSGHIGGANNLTHQVANAINAIPIITTATDVHNVPAIDVLAVEHQLYIENPEKIKLINKAFLQKKKVHIVDPFQILKPVVPKSFIQDNLNHMSNTTLPKVCIDDQIKPIEQHTLQLRPASLTIGIGCNRHTPAVEIEALIIEVLNKAQLSIHSVFHLASIDLKNDEQGLLEVSKNLNIPLRFFSKKELEVIKDVPNPSNIVKKHIGVQSVCEAAAILSTNKGQLIIPKKTSPNVTVAIARVAYTL